MRKQSTQITFFIITIFLLTISLLTYRKLSNYIDEVKWIRHSNSVANTLDLMLSSINDAETGYLGYHLTRDSLFLSAYYKSLNEIPLLINSLDSLVSNDLKQAKRVDSLNASIQHQFLIIHQFLAHANEPALYMDSIENNLLHRSKENMKVIRSQTERIIAAEHDIFNQQIERKNDFKGITPIVILVSTLLAILAAVIVFFRTIDVLRKREKAEKDLAEQIALVKGRELLLKEAEVLANMGSWKWALKDDAMVWSDGLYRILGQTHTFVLSWNTFIESVHSDDKDILQKFIDKAIATNKGFRMEYRAIVRETIRYFYIAVTAETEIEKGNILGVVVDITDQKLKEDQLQQIVLELNEEEKKYSTLFERSIDPIFLAKLDFTLIDLNEAFLTYFEYSKEEEVNITIRQIFAEEKDFNYFITTLKNAQPIKDFEVLLINKLGQRKWCLMNCVFIPDQSADFCSYQGIIHDITLLKRAERELVRAERITLTDKMARIVAHEIRNPLTNLNLALEQLKDEMPQSNENVILYTDIIQRNANRIENLIGDMLNSSKPKELQLELITINDLIEETLALALDRLNLKEIDLEKKYTENLFRILVDKEKVKIALLNIIINAIEAMTEQKGKLIIATFQKDDMITISITDNGKGMSADDVERLYEPFFTGKPSGLGLGLTSTKNILSSHNADIHVTSEIGKGTTFSVMFKLAE